jgi:cysteine desulfurase / selenocysteine lyase
MDIQTPAYYRQLVAGVDTQVVLPSGRTVTPINFDNAATTPPLIPVINELVNFAPLYSSVHRGTGAKAELTQEHFEGARKLILNFFSTEQASNVVIFVKNTTEGINKLSYRLLKPGKKRIVLSTTMEHHSNDLPWRNKYQIDYVQTDPLGRLLLDDLETKLRKYRGAVQLVTVTGASNVTGYINPVHEIAELAHRYGAQIHVDGAQSVPHFPMDMKRNSSPQHIDFLTFSAHKMYAPYGTGVLIGPKRIFQQGSPEYSGGGTVRQVTRDQVIWDDPPFKEEAGTPNVMGVIALGAAIRTLTALGMDRLYAHERQLVEYALHGLRQIPKVKIYTSLSPGEPRVGIVPFNIIGKSHQAVADFLAREAGIAVRNGCFCAQPYVRKLLGIPAEQTEADHHTPGMVRISFGLYNQPTEIDCFLQAIRHLASK